MALTQVKTGAIADDAVTLAKQAAGTDGQIITYDASGNPTAVGPGTDGQVLTSTGAGSPPAFETLPATVGGATGVDFNDNVKIRSGTGNDLEIYHDGSHSYIDNTGTGNLYLKDAGAIKVRTASFGVDNADGSEAMIAAAADGAVELYHNNVKKLNTDSGGIEVVGAVMPSGNISMVDSALLKIGTGDDLQIYHDGTRSYINNATGALYLESGSTEIGLIKGTYASGEWMLRAINDGAVELYYNNSKKIETTNIGCDIPLTSSGDGLRLYSTGNVWGKISADVNRTNTSGGMLSLQGLWNGAQVNIIELQTGDDTTNKDDGRIAFYTRNSGDAIRNNFKIEPDGTIEIPNDNQKLTFGASDDITIYHDGTNSNNKFEFSSDLKFRPKGSEDGLTIAVDGAVTLYHDDSWRLRTNSSGGEARNAFTIRGDESTTATLHMNADEADDGDDMWKLQANTSGEFKIESNNGGSWNDVFKLKDNIYSELISQRTSQSGYVLKISKNGSGVSDSVQSTMFVFDVNSNGRGKAVSGSSGSSDPQWSTYSDRRLKTNFRNYTGGYDKIKAIPVKLYDEVSNDETKSVIGDTPATNVVGWVADEFQTVFPEAVTGTKDAVDSDGKPVFQELAAGTIFPHLVQALQTAITKIETLETKVAALEAA